MADRSRDWFLQAERDLEHAEDCLRAGRHEWACFVAQQAAEKSIKALHLRLGQGAWGDVVARLLAELPATHQPSTELIDKAKVLDAFYIPTRYPNGHPEGAPFQNYGPLQSGEAIRYAREIIEFVRPRLA